MATSDSFTQLANESEINWLRRLIKIGAPVDVRANVQAILQAQVEYANLKSQDPNETEMNWLERLNKSGAPMNLRLYVLDIIKTKTYIEKSKLQSKQQAIDHKPAGVTSEAAWFRSLRESNCWSPDSGGLDRDLQSLKVTWWLKGIGSFPTLGMSASAVSQPFVSKMIDKISKSNSRMFQPHNPITDLLLPESVDVAFTVDPIDSLSSASAT